MLLTLISQLFFHYFSEDLTLSKSVCVIEGECPAGDWAPWSEWGVCFDKNSTRVRTKSRLCVGPGPCDGAQSEMDFNCNEEVLDVVYAMTHSQGGQRFFQIKNWD